MVVSSEISLMILPLVCLSNPATFCSTTKTLSLRFSDFFSLFTFDLTATISLRPLIVSDKLSDALKSIVIYLFRWVRPFSSLRKFKSNEKLVACVLRL